VSSKRIHHHDRQEHTECEEEYSVNVMRDCVAYLRAEGEKQNASDDVEGGSENDITENPSVVESTENEDELRHDVDDDADCGEYEIGDEKADGFGVVEYGDVLEGRHSDEKADAPNNKAR